MNQSELDFGSPKDHPFFKDLAPHVVEKFFTYHAENPQIYESFKKYANQLRGAGRDYHSSYAIMERIRWDSLVSANNEPFKINNNYRPCYSRLLMIQDPTFVGFFRTRKSPGTVPV